MNSKERPGGLELMIFDRGWFLRCVTIVFVACNFVCAAAAQDLALPEVSAKRGYEYLQVLAGQVGERAAGTDGEALAVDYISKQFKSWGLETTLLPVSVPVWHERRARLWVDGEPTIDFPAKAVVFAGLTPTQGVTGEFVDVGSASSQQLQGKDLKGKIVLIERDVYAEYPDVWLTDRLTPLGVAGMIFYSSPGRKGIPTVYFNFKRALKETTPASVVISYEDALRLARTRPKRLGLVVQADIEWKESHCVIGELKGSVKPDEVVVVGAHDDTAYTSPGASDDAGGVAVVMELARAFAEGPRPARTLRFVAWGGHELGLMGSETYLRKHADEVAQTIAYINYDIVGGPLGSVFWGAAGDDEWSHFVRSTSQSLGLGNSGGTNVGDTDATNFGALEVPSVQIGAGFGNDNHTPWDNLDTTSASGMEGPLRLGAAITKRLAADTNLRFPHKFPPELLKEIRNDESRYGWGVLPEGNQPPREK